MKIRKAVEQTEWSLAMMSIVESKQYTRAEIARVELWMILTNSEIGEEMVTELLPDELSEEDLDGYEVFTDWDGDFRFSPVLMEIADELLSEVTGNAGYIIKPFKRLMDKQYTNSLPGNKS